MLTRSLAPGLLRSWKWRRENHLWWAANGIPIFTVHSSSKLIGKQGKNIEIARVKKSKIHFRLEQRKQNAGKSTRRADGVRGSARERENVMKTGITLRDCE